MLAISNHEADMQAQYVMQIDRNGSKMQVLKIKRDESGFAHILQTSDRILNAQYKLFSFSVIFNMGIGVSK